MSVTATGVWIAYHSDWSGFRVFAGELSCLRHAVKHDMDAVLCPYGEDPRDVVRKQQSERARAAATTTKLGEPTS